jgi:HSP20 family protein
MPEELTMSRDMIRLMHAFFLPGVEAGEQAPWRPNMDVIRTPTGWVVKFELAGVRAEDIDLEALGRRLTLRGIRRDDVTAACAAEPKTALVHYRLEIAYSRFERSVELPCDLKRAAISTEYRDGMLLVRILPAQSGEGGRQEEANL